MPVRLVALQVKLKGFLSRIVICNIQEIFYRHLGITHHPDVITLIKDMLFHCRQIPVPVIIMVVFLPRKSVLCRQCGGGHCINPRIHSLFLEDFLQFLCLCIVGIHGLLICIPKGKHDIRRL